MLRISLFTAIPVQKACDFIKEKLKQDRALSHRLHLNIDDIVSILIYVLPNKYFIFDGKHTNKYTDVLWREMAIKTTAVYLLRSGNLLSTIAFVS